MVAGPALLRVLGVATISLGLVAQAAALDFDRTFESADQQQHSHYIANYRLQDGEHRVEVWREGDTRIRRRTDDAIETFLTRPSGSVEWTMTILDLRRKVRTDVDRTSLLRVGHFTDWFAQAHSLTRPRGNYLLEVVGAVGGVTPIAACQWYRLTVADHASTICWSVAHAVPLVVIDQSDEIVWRVIELSSGALGPEVFTIEDTGFARNDANEDIRGD
jgi:hypothetical protein